MHISFGHCNYHCSRIIIDIHAYPFHRNGIAFVVAHYLQLVSDILQLGDLHIRI